MDPIHHSFSYHLFHPTCDCIKTKKEMAGYIALNALMGLSTGGTAYLAYYCWNQCYSVQDKTGDADFAIPFTPILHDSSKEASHTSLIKEENFLTAAFDNQAKSKMASQPLEDQVLETEFQQSGAPVKDAYYREKFIDWKISQYQDAHWWIRFLNDNTTFPTTTFKLSLEEGQSLIAQYQHLVNKKKPPSAFQQNVLQQLEERLDKQIKDLQLAYSSPSNEAEETPIFVRLSTRSPKDAIFFSGTDNHERMKTQLGEKLAQISADPQLIQDPDLLSNAELTAFATSAVEALKVYNGKEALALLLNSERVFVDLLKSADFPDLWNMSVILRLFEPIPYSMEFRGFVYDKKLTALSQYDPYLYFPQLADENIRKQIIKRISEFFEAKIKDSVPFDHYIIDFGVKSLDEDKERQVLTIEINSFEKSTGAGLFSWSQDLELLQGKEENGEAIPLKVIEDVKSVAPLPFLEWLSLIEEVKNTRGLI